MIIKAFYVIILIVRLFLIKEVKNLGEILSKNMKSNLGTQPVNGEKVRMGFVIATLLDMIGGSSVNKEQSKIDKEVKEVEKSQNEEYIKQLTEMVTSYKTGKVKPSKKILQEYKDGKLKAEKGPKMKKAEMQIQNAEKGPKTKKAEIQTDSKESREREER